MEKNTSEIEKLKSMIRDIEFAMLTTVSPDGTLHSRPMGNLDLSNFNGTLWFFSRSDSFKNHDIETDQHVNLAYANPKKQQYVSISGRAFVSFDKEKMKELWNPILKAWFPEGLDDPTISLIGVDVESAELWDSPPGAFVQIAGFVKSQLTGTPMEQKHNSRHVDLKSDLTKELH